MTNPNRLFVVCGWALFVLGNKHSLAQPAKKSTTFLRSAERLKKGFFGLASLAENVDINLWAYQTPDGKSIRKAYHYLLPYAKGKKPWDYKQIKAMHREDFLPLETVAKLRYGRADDPDVPNPTTAENGFFTLTSSLF